MIIIRQFIVQEHLCLLFMSSLWLSLALSTNAQDPFDCKVSFDGGKVSYDLTSLSGEHSISRTRITPPTSMFEEVQFDLCGDLARKDGVADGDQCESGTRACLTATNKKENTDDRVIYTIPLALSSSLNAQTSRLSSPKGLQVSFSGGSYPETDPLPQSFTISLLCATTYSDPTFSSYNGEEFKVEWNAPAGCAFASGDNSDNKGGDQNVGSGIGWFFLLLIIAFIAYFILGAYYNYSTYGASGIDLIPHKDFWREVPYMLRDVAAHLCSVIRPSPRNGYIAV